MENEQVRLKVAAIISKWQDRMFEDFDNIDATEEQVEEALTDLGEFDLEEAYINWTQES